MLLIPLPVSPPPTSADRECTPQGRTLQLSEEIPSLTNELSGRASFGKKDSGSWAPLFKGMSCAQNGGQLAARALAGAGWTC